MHKCPPGMCAQVRCDWSLSPAEESLLTSIVFLGTIVGSFLWGALSDAKGRRLGFASTAGCIFLFGVASALAPSYAVRLPNGNPKELGATFVTHQPPIRAYVSGGLGHPTATTVLSAYGVTGPRPRFQALITKA